MDNPQNDQDKNTAWTKINRGIDYSRMWQRGSLGVVGIVIFIGGLVRFSWLAIIAGIILAIAGIGGAWQLWKKV